MGFLDFTNLKDNNFQSMPVYSGAAGAITDGCLHKNYMVLAIGSQLTFLDENFVAIVRPTPVAFVAVKSNGSRLFGVAAGNLYYSDDDGVTWSLGVVTGVGSARNMAVHLETVIATNGSSVRVSIDNGLSFGATAGLVNWQTPDQNFKQCMRFFPQLGLWVAVGFETVATVGQVAYSADGVNWACVVLPATSFLSTCEIYNGKLYLFEGTNGFGRVWRMNLDFTNLEPVVSASQTPVVNSALYATSTVIFEGILYLITGTGGGLGVFRLVGNKFVILPYNQPGTASRFSCVFDRNLYWNGSGTLYTNMRSY